METAGTPALAADSEAFWGLTDNTEIVSATSVAGFEWNGTLFRAVTKSAGAATTNTNLTQPGTDIVHTLRIWRSGSTIQFYVDGALAATHTTTIPTAPARLRTVLANSIGGITDRVMTIVGVWGDLTRT